MTNSCTLGNFELSIFTDGTYLADGGAMFGVVPKVMWEKKAPADELNRIRNDSRWEWSQLFSR